MKCFRIITCILLIFMATMSAGCRGNLSGITRGIGKVINGIGKEAKQEVAEEVVRQAAGGIAGSSTGNNGSVGKKGGGMKSNAAKAGVAAVTGAVVANEANAYSQNVYQAKEVLVGYYLAIADRRMRDAYNSLSWEMQNQLGTYESFSRGYGTTVSNEVSNLQLISETENSVVMTYQLTSKDNINGKLVTQVFLGKATLSKIGDIWLISDFDVKVK